MAGQVLAMIEWTETASAVSDVVVAVFTIAAATGVFLVLSQIRLQHKQLHRELENLYVERYWVVLDRLSETAEGTPERERAVRAYLSLSEDQCDMRAQDRVTDETWAVWGPSVFSLLIDPEFEAALDEQPEDQFIQLKEMRGRGRDYDPSTLPPKSRKKLGL